MRADAAPSLAGDKEAAPPEKQAAPAGVFAGLRFLFWVVAFTGPLKNGYETLQVTAASYTCSCELELPDMHLTRGAASCCTSLSPCNHGYRCPFNNHSLSRILNKAIHAEWCEDICKCRAQKAGATVADELDPSVTHVIAQKGTSAKQASAKLQTAGTHSPVLVRVQHCTFTTSHNP